MTITMVYPANIMSIWDETSPLLEPAVSIAGTHSMEDIRKSLLGGLSQLWVQWNAGVEVAVITEFVPYPQGIWFRFWLAGARDGIKAEWERFFTILVDFAKSNSCAGVEDCGRIGWAKYCPEEAKTIGTVRRMPFHKQAPSGMI